MTCAICFELILPGQLADDHHEVYKCRGGKAIVATGRKLLVMIFVMLKKVLDYSYIEDRLYNEKLRALRAAA